MLQNPFSNRVILTATLFATALMGWSVVVPAVELGAQEVKPNIIFLLADDQTTDSMGCYGNTDVKTPNLDRLAAEGMAFDNHYNTTAICMASRASIMTGMYEYKTGCNFEHGNLMQNNWNKSYPVLLKKAGYMVGFAGKFGFEVESPDGSAEMPIEFFDRWGGGPGQTSYVTSKNKSMTQYAKQHPHSTTSYGAFGSDFVREAVKADRPFCLSISFKAPHKPATPDPQFDHVYQGKKFTRPENFGREFAEHFSKQSKQGRQYARFHDWNYSSDFDGEMVKYHQQIYAIDVAVGMIRKAIDDQGVRENTVIIYTSDNGYFNGAHGYGSKVLPYEESTRAPMIVYDPRHINSGKKLRSEALTGNIDIAPSILALAGVEAPKSMDGRSFIPLYSDPKAEVRSSLALINVWGPAETHSFGVVTKDWKYVYWNYGEPGFTPTEELFHTYADPLEMTNSFVNPQHIESLQAMRDTYDQAVEAWKRESVPYNSYQQYGMIFDRHVDWSEKRDLIKKKKRQ